VFEKGDIIFVFDDVNGIEDIATMCELGRRVEEEGLELVVCRLALPMSSERIVELVC
jgi:hypothetical protein